MAIKAKVIATGEIVEVYCYDGKWVNMQNRKEVYMPKEIDINYDKDKPYSPDYWTRLEHQYAGMAMQGMITHYGEIDEMGDLSILSNQCVMVARDLVEKLKQKEESK